ncbi:uncharacterized protein LOC120473712 [Pimephales promelas]|uniref:uncharacterized protein LOC120473712 n=1 Tax=Pimephales promelas TaxID=90988 RepID=UPI001955BC4B|nr:uncharacterized protein LOC120473712 [Pimephales promelas]KAG1930773.1 hypothetical protein F2P79_022094 [Pimephales promelas]KAG1930774.1 hypothetical protein F2P79_022094 [Pimephales promelas]
MEFRISSLLSLILLCNSPCIISSQTEHSDIYERSSQQSTPSQTNHIQVRVRPENSLHIHSGETLVLQCRDQRNEVVAQWWQTPFGLFNGCNHQNKDPVETCNGTLRISRATSSHDGLYFCIHLDKMSKTIVPYRISVVALNPNIKKLRTTREVYTDTLSESHFAAAVASSVIVSFLVAFTLGAFSRSYIIKCLQTIRACIPYRKENHNHISGQNNKQTTREQPETVFFHKNHNTGEDTVDIGLDDQELSNANDVDAVENADGGEDDTNQTQSCEGEEQNQEFRSVVSPHPKKKSRIIKVYNYDEEGNQYSHIKAEANIEGDVEVRPKLRTQSLTRLNAIMKQADINPVRASAESQSTQPDDPSHATGDGLSQTSQETL